MFVWKSIWSDLRDFSLGDKTHIVNRLLFCRMRSIEKWRWKKEMTEKRMNEVRSSGLVKLLWWFDLVASFWRIAKYSDVKDRTIDTGNQWNMPERLCCFAFNRLNLWTLSKLTMTLSVQRRYSSIEFRFSVKWMGNQYVNRFQQVEKRLYSFR